MTEQNLDTAARAAEEQKACTAFICCDLSHRRTLSRMARGLSPALQVSQKFGERHGVEDAVRRHASLACHFYTPMHMIELPDRMRVGIDAEDATVLKRLLVPAPVEVEPRPCADGAVFRRCVLWKGSAGFSSALKRRGLSPFEYDLVSQPLLVR